jgi:hypothetical protein
LSYTLLEILNRFIFLKYIFTLFPTAFASFVKNLGYSIEYVHLPLLTSLTLSFTFLRLFAQMQGFSPPPNISPPLFYLNCRNPFSASLSLSFFLSFPLFLSFLGSFDCVFLGTVFSFFFLFLVLRPNPYIFCFISFHSSIFLRLAQVILFCFMVCFVLNFFIIR